MAQGAGDGSSWECLVPLFPGADKGTWLLPAMQPLSHTPAHACARYPTERCRLPGDAQSVLPFNCGLDQVCTRSGHHSTRNVLCCFCSGCDAVAPWNHPSYHSLNVWTPDP
jgi:hypothetical protein